MGDREEEEETTAAAQHPSGDGAAAATRHRPVAAVLPLRESNDAVKREIYVAFNMSHLPVVVSIPERPGYRWEPMVDTGKAAPYDFLPGDVPDRATVVSQYAHFLDSNIFLMLSYSSIILLLQPDA